MTYGVSLFNTKQVKHILIEEGYSHCGAKTIRTLSEGDPDLQLRTCPTCENLTSGVHPKKRDRYNSMTEEEVLQSKSAVLLKLLALDYKARYEELLASCSSLC
jgi:hypothetical protein